ncbi:MAG TPA: sulfotransferase [Geminicoccus sp.]|uniref:sulfotransferase family protein n=1 Tax=Geminicoccus sp. TaxID=2024832 RepID=UPI002B92BE8F|nr:sulfotransferase [Geminicoccus sp.]HWL71884.1 sulfotransferase [Geminicoccus sp.]
MMANLFIIGAAKAGTTALHQYLGQHPAILMSPVKEPNYFAFPQGLPAFAGPESPDGSSFIRDRLRRETYGLSVLDRASYERLFIQGRDRKLRGESSAAYLYFPGCAERIHAAVPDARIIAILREPVDRAFSKYRQMRRDRVEPLTSFTAAIAAEPERQRAGWAPTWLYLDRGRYHRQLQPFFARFDRRQIHVLLYDDLRADPPGTLRGIFTFLGVDPDVPIDMGEAHNRSGVAETPRFGLLYDLTIRPYLMSPRLQSLMPRGFAAAIRPWARRLMLRQAENVPEALPPDLATELRAGMRDELERLQDLIGRDLSHWLAPVPPRHEPARVLAEAG